MASASFLRKMASLVALGSADHAALACLPFNRAETRKRGDVLALGDQPSFLYVLEAGWAARYGLRSDGSRRITGFMLPGDFCGIHAVAGAAMDHAITALEPCQVSKVPIGALEEAVASSPAIEKALWRAKLVDEAVLRRWLLMSADAFEAIGHLFCELYMRADEAGLVQDGRCQMPLIQNDIGDAVGVTAVHVNRTLQRMRAEGLIRLSQRELILEDASRLRRESRFDASYLHPWRTPATGREQMIALA